MAKISRDAQEILGRDFLQTVHSSDMPSLFRETVHRGWTVEGDALLLTSFREAYFGERSKFSTASDYETAVNGRGVPDLDIEAVGRERIRLLMCRGVAFAWNALHSVNLLFPGRLVTARISSAPIIMDPDTYTGYVTFFSSKITADCLDPEGDVEPPGIQILLSSDEL